MTEVNTLELSKVFESLQPANADTYIYSVPYYLITGRKGTTVYNDKKSYLVLCKHPNKEDAMLVFPELGGNQTLTANVLLFLHQKDIETQLARYTSQDYHQLQAALSLISNNTAIEIKNMPEDLLDWTYPIRILDTEITGNMRGAGFEKLRNKFFKAANELTVLPLQDPSAMASMRASLHFWIGGLIFSGNSEANQYMGFYESLFKNMEEHPSLFDGFVVLSRGEPAGFTVWDTVSQRTANALAGISRRSIKGMSEFQTVTACKILQEKGIKFYNMGGSENDKLDNYKLKYRPSHSLEVASYQVKYKTNETSSIQKFTLVN